MNKLKVFKNDCFEVEAMRNENGEILLDAEKVALALGIFTVAKSGNACVRWKRVNEHLLNTNVDKENSFGFTKSEIKKGDFITESQMYMLIMKSNSKLAIDFQMWVATEVLPSIRQYGAFISENADKETVDKLEKFHKFRIKRTFAEAEKTDIEKIYAEFLDFTSTMKATNRITAYNSAIKGLNVFKDTVESNAYKMLSLEKIQELTRRAAITKNQINGGEKAYKTKTINKLTTELEEIKDNMEEWIEYAKNLYPFEENFKTINIHPFSTNSMYENRHKSFAYRKWIQNFPKVNIDLNKYHYYEVFIEYENMPKFDTDNFSKSLVDQITRITGVDDSMFKTINAKTINFVDTYREGKIHIAIKDIATNEYVKIA